MKKKKSEKKKRVIRRIQRYVDEANGTEVRCYTRVGAKKDIFFTTPVKAITGQIVEVKIEDAHTVDGAYDKLEASVEKFGKEMEEKFKKKLQEKQKKIIKAGMSPDELMDIVQKQGMDEEDIKGIIIP